MRNFWRLGFRTFAAVLIAGLAQEASAQGATNGGRQAGTAQSGTIGLAAGLPKARRSASPPKSPRR